jgi:hypothetical protein
MAKPKISRESLDRLYSIRTEWLTGRQRYDSIWQENAKLINPSMSEWNDVKPQQGKGPADYSAVYDPEAMKASNKFAEGLQAYSFGRNLDWQRIATEDPDLMKKREVATWLQESNMLMVRRLAKTNFYDEGRTFVKSCADFGTGVMFRDTDYVRGVPCYKTLHLKRTLIGENQYGEVDVLFREFYLYPWEAAGKFGEENLPDQIRHASRDKAPAAFKFLQMVFPGDRFDLDFGGREKGQKFYSLYVADVDKFEPVSDGGYAVKPFWVWRWGRNMDGDVWGVDSPGMIEASNVRQLNGERADFSRLVQLQGRPPVKATEGMRAEGIRLEPNARHFLRAGQDFVTVPVVGDLTGIAADMEMLRRSIRDSYYVDFFLMMQANLERVKTATEVMAMKGEQAAMLAAMAGRLTYEFLEPAVEDMFSMELMFQRLPEIPAMLKGQDVRIDLISPLAQLQKRYLLLNETDEFVGRILQVAQITQDPTKLDSVDFDQYIQVIAEAYNTDRRIVRDLVDVQRMQQRRAQAQAQIATDQLNMQKAQTQAQVYTAGTKAPEPGSPSATLTAGPQR